MTTAIAKVRSGFAAIELRALTIGHKLPRKETKVVAENVTATLR